MAKYSQPTTVLCWRNLWDGAIEIYCYGKESGWVSKKRLAKLCSITPVAVKTVLCPDTSRFNALICQPEDLTEGSKIERVILKTGFAADGVHLPRNTAVKFAVADCPIIIARHDATGETIAAHAGRSSLLDEQWLAGLASPRYPESVVDAIFERLIRTRGRRPIELEAISVLGVGPWHFRHPLGHRTFGELNQRRSHYLVNRWGKSCFLSSNLDPDNLDWGMLDLHQLIRRQFQTHGVPADNLPRLKKDGLVIDIADPRKRHLFFSRRGGDKKGHNTILVVRRR